MSYIPNYIKDKQGGGKVTRYVPSSVGGGSSKGKLGAYLSGQNDNNDSTLGEQSLAESDISSQIGEDSFSLAETSINTSGTNGGEVSFSSLVSGLVSHYEVLDESNKSSNKKTTRRWKPKKPIPKTTSSEVVEDDGDYHNNN